MLLLIGLLQGGALAGNKVKANLLLFLEYGSKKRDEIHIHGAKIVHGGAIFRHWKQEKS